MLIIGLFTHVHCALARYKSRKALSSISTQQLFDIGMTHDEKQAQLTQASVLGFMRDVLRSIQKKRRAR